MTLTPTHQFPQAQDPWDELTAGRPLFLRREDGERYTVHEAIDDVTDLLNPVDPDITYRCHAIIDRILKLAGIKKATRTHDTTDCETLHQRRLK